MGKRAGLAGVSTHSRPKAAGVKTAYDKAVAAVSTHSRPKAAGRLTSSSTGFARCFNTQPPEGGWKTTAPICNTTPCFNTQPPEGGWSRSSNTPLRMLEFQHTAARRRLVLRLKRAECVFAVSTHSRPKAAGYAENGVFQIYKFQHTAARRRLGKIRAHTVAVSPFQHTAARRRLGRRIRPRYRYLYVSTHSRPKAAGRGKAPTLLSVTCFNTQPPEGGWSVSRAKILPTLPFQHTAARRRLGRPLMCFRQPADVSTHSRPKAAGGAGHTPFSGKMVSTHSRPKAAGKPCWRP